MNTKTTHFKTAYELKKYIDNGNAIHKPFTVYGRDKVFNNLGEYKEFINRVYGIEFKDINRVHANSGISDK